jgi:hypothetical protein
MLAVHPNQALLIEELEQHLIRPKAGLSATYQQLEGYTKHFQAQEIQSANVVDFQEPLKSYLKANQHQLTTLAIDLPVYFKAHNPTTKTLMICAMDPLPPLPTSVFWKDKNVRFNEDVGFWAPFSLIDDWENPTGSMHSNLPFFATLLQHYNLYITDIYKLFFRFEEQMNFANSNTIPAFTAMKNKSGVSLHGALLAREMELVNPTAVITLGNAARNNLLAMNEMFHAIPQNPGKWTNDLQKYYWNSNRLIIASPHISGAANGAKSAILTNPSYNHISGKYQNERLAKIILAQLPI